MDYSCSNGKDHPMILCANPKAQYLSYESEINDAIQRVLQSNRYILGSEVEEFEKEFADFIGVSSAIGVANGTDAIEIALRSLDIGYGDEVITVSHTAVATVAAIEATGAVPVLVDVDENTFTLDPNQLTEVFTEKTKAVIVVHIYGQSGNLKEIESFCKKKNLYLIEDVSQAHGARYLGKRLGSFGNISCFSCYPTKNLGAIGDAGIVCTNDLNLANKMKMIREYGWKQRYISEISGRNSRLDELQAAILRVKLRNLDKDNESRKRIASTYTQSLSDCPIQLPKILDSNDHVFHLYVIRVKARSDLISFLKEKQIFPSIHYPIPIHLQSAYRHRVKLSSSMVITEAIAEDVLSLPIYPELSLLEVNQVVSSIREFFQS